MNKFHPVSWCFNCWFKTRKYQLGYFIQPKMKPKSVKQIFSEVILCWTPPFRKYFLFVRWYDNTKSWEVIKSMFQFKNSNTMLSCHHIRLLREKKTKAMYFQSNVLKSALQFFFQDIITFHVIIAASIFFSPTKNGIKSQLSPLFVPPREMRKKISLFTKGGRSRYGNA